MAEKEIFWIKCLPADFLSDSDLQGMDAEQRGVAFWLWMTLYCNNGKLKYNIRRLSNICCASTDVVEEVIAEKFQVVDGNVTHKRVDKEIAESLKRYQKAKKAADARWGNAKIPTKECPNDANALHKHDVSNANTIQYNGIEHNKPLIINKSKLKLNKQKLIKQFSGDYGIYYRWFETEFSIETLDERKAFKYWAKISKVLNEIDETFNTWISDTIMDIKEKAKGQDIKAANKMFSSCMSNRIADMDV